MKHTMFFCPNCAKTGKNMSGWSKKVRSDAIDKYYTGYIFEKDTVYSEGEFCKFCNGPVIDTHVKARDVIMLEEDFGCSRELLETMIELRNKDVVEYEIKMGELRNISQQKHALEEQNRKVPRCPICGSADLSKISEKGKFWSLALGGIYGAEDLGKTWQCRNCGSKF